MKKYFITGLVILLPLALTVAIVVFTLNFLTRPFIGIATRFLEHYDLFRGGFWFLTREEVIQHGSRLLIVVSLLFFTVLIGMLARWFFIKSLIKLGDYLITRIPVVNNLYRTTQEVIKTIFASKGKSFKQVVLVPYPNPDTFCVGLVSMDAPEICSRATNEDLVSVFVPTTPNPTSGFLLMFKRRDLILLDMTVEQALKFIISCGVMRDTDNPSHDVHTAHTADAPRLQTQT